MRLIRRAVAAFAAAVPVAALATAGGWDLPVLLKGEVPIELFPRPATAPLRQYIVTVDIPRDTEMAARGGSGGPMFELTVRHRESGFISRSVFQAIFISVQDRGRAPPQFSVWTKTGANYPVYCRYAFIERTGEYCALFCEDYEVNETATVRTQSGRRWGECGVATTQ